MEELKNVSSAPKATLPYARKPYEAPTADIILLVPQEELSAWDTKYHTNDADRWALNGWGYNKLGDPASGTYGTVKPNSWTLPTE